MRVRVRFAALAATAILGLAFASAACGGDDGGNLGPPESQTQTAAGIGTREAAITPLAGVTIASGVTTVLISTSSTGPYLTDTRGFTLYTSTNDPDGRSVCLRSCTGIMQPLIVEGGTPTGPGGLTGTLGTITREDDGATQVTYNDRPLYTYVLDVQPGDAKGSNLGDGIWTIAVP
jgi:predicted lipoprotein with Yx(FWY)xxD motif